MLRLSPEDRWNLVREAFEPTYGPLYAGESCTEALWEMTEPSVDTSVDGPERVQNEETARRVAAAIAVTAYGVDAIK